VIEIVPATDIPALADARALIRAHITAHSTVHDAASTAALIAALPAPYEPPAGGLWVARRNGAAVGCVALQALVPTVGEIKRMYVEPAHRGQGVARALAAHVVEEARVRHYDTLRLGTLRAMRPAQRLYESLGFREIAPYRPIEFGDTVFYELSLGVPAAITSDL
jgi:ribosomal protein S18 acetylase RimI-like enzyme